jgi:hypothetical protein
MGSCTYSQHQREIELRRRRRHGVEVGLDNGAELRGAGGVDFVGLE